MRFLIIILLCALLINDDRHEAKQHVLLIIPLQCQEGSIHHFLRNKISAAYCGHCILRAPLTLPSTLMNDEKSRYRADKIINHLHSMTGRDTTAVGIIHEDISMTKGDIKDYGIMGLSHCPGKACVASSFRLNKKNIKSQWLKITVHEIGHSYGLPHCAQKQCIMRDAKGRNHADELKNLCVHCKQVFEEHHWDIEKLIFD